VRVAHIYAGVGQNSGFSSLYVATCAYYVFLLIYLLVYSWSAGACVCSAHAELLFAGLSGLRAVVLHC
jgi:hypothetical protein